MFPSTPPKTNMDAKNDTPRKTNMDTKNDGLEKVAPFKNGIFGIYVRFLGCKFQQLADHCL